jgi:hypothetical protein
VVVALLQYVDVACGVYQHIAPPAAAHDCNVTACTVDTSKHFRHFDLQQNVAVQQSRWEPVWHLTKALLVPISRVLLQPLSLEELLKKKKEEQELAAKVRCSSAAR